MNYDEAAKIMMIDNSSGKDPRIVAIERARELCRASFLSGWEIRIKTSDELDGHHIEYHHNNDPRSYSHYSEMILWSCYYKNDEFMFAYSSDHCTNIIGDFYRTSDGEIYKSYDRIAVIPDEIEFTLKNEYSDSSPAYGRYFTLSFNMTEVYHYYNQDGSVRSEGENLYTISWSTPSINNSIMTQWSGLAVFRSNYQTYINDVLDFCSN